MKIKLIGLGFSAMIYMFLLGSSCSRNDSFVPTLTTEQFTNIDTSYMALLEVVEDNSISIDNIVANTGYKPIYNLLINTLSGDILRIRSQIEISNNDLDKGCSAAGITVRGHTRIKVDGNVVGSFARQNNVRDLPDYLYNTHHMPIWADAIVKVTHNGQTDVKAEYAASSSRANIRVKIEPSSCNGSSTPYGHLLIEHYRLFPSYSAAKSAGTFGLFRVGEDRIQKSTAFGTIPSTPTTIYQIDQNVTSGDIVRLLGQATTSYANRLEFQGQGLYRNGTRISPWSTENNIQTVPYLPLWTDCVDKILNSGNNQYALRLHGGYGGAGVVNAGYLYALHFKPLNSTFEVKQLLDAETVLGSSLSLLLPANTGWHNIVNYSINAKANDILKLTGFLQLAYPNNFTLGINCQMRLKISTSIISQAGKYITQRTEMLPLRTELIYTIPSTGNYSISLEAICSRSNANPNVEIVGSSSGILIERFGK